MTNEEYANQIAARPSRLVITPFFGGKARLLSFLLPRLPPLPNFVEPFGGAASVLINRPRMEGREVYGDINEGLVNMFTDLRDRPEHTVWRMRFTPYARRTLAEARQQVPDGLAMRNGLFQSVASMAVQRGHWWAQGKHKASNAHAEAARCGLSREGWLPVEEAPLYQIARRLDGVELLHANAFTLLREWLGQDDTLIYIDPPYLIETRRGDGGELVFELSHQEHEELLALCLTARAHVAVSGYPSPLYEQALKDWRRVNKAAYSSAGYGRLDGKRTEVLWTNY